MEIQQDASGGNLRVPRDEYFKRVAGKTSALLRVACRTGGEMAGADTDTLEKLDSLALTIGLAFQMDDDALDYMGSPGSLGKGVSVDLRSGLTTLPLIIARETGDALMLRLTRPDAMPGGLRRRRIGRRVAFLGAAESARQEAADMYSRAKDIASGLPGSGPADFGSIIEKLEGRAR
jgi:octaprenyl-diphosphate synthase